MKSGESTREMLKSKGAVVTGAASAIGKTIAERSQRGTNRFLQYPVMSTLRPSYPSGPWH